MSLTCTCRSSGPGEGFPGATSRILLLWAKRPSSTLAQAEKSCLLPAQETPVLREALDHGVEQPHRLGPQTPREAQAAPLPGCPPGEGEGNLPVQGQGKRVRMAHQGSFPPQGTLHPSPDLCDCLLAAHSVLVLTSLSVDSPRFHQSVIFLKCNSDHVTFLLKILQQVPTVSRMEILTALHGIQAVSCFGSLATSHSLHHHHPQHPAPVIFISVILSNVWFCKPLPPGLYPCYSHCLECPSIPPSLPAPFKLFTF